MNKLEYLRNLPVGETLLGTITGTTFEKLEDTTHGLMVRVLVSKATGLTEGQEAMVPYHNLTTLEWNLIEAL